MTQKYFRTEADWRKIYYEVEQEIKKGEGVKPTLKKMKIPFGTFYSAIGRLNMPMPGNAKTYRKKAKTKPTGEFIKFAPVQVGDVKVCVYVGEVKVECLVKDLKAVLEALK